MPRASNSIDVYIEAGAKRTFAGALDWPGWCRSGRDEAGALEALAAYAPRYASVLRGARLRVEVPADASAFVVRERLRGNATTDFGAPDIAPAADARPVDAAELRRLQAILRACWRAFDSTVSAAGDRELRKGPRGGGRDAPAIVQHVLGADAAYLSGLGCPIKRGKDSPAAELARTRRAILDGLAASTRGELPARRPRGGLSWPARYATRRIAWHVLDHAWEIEDRVV